MTSERTRDVKDATARWTRPWGRLTADRRKTAAGAYIAAADGVPVARGSVSAVLARESRSRVKAVERWAPDARGDCLSRVASLDPPLIAAILARFFVDTAMALSRAPSATTLRRSALGRARASRDSGTCPIDVGAAVQPRTGRTSWN